jgi:hypothetical protein
VDQSVATSLPRTGQAELDARNPQSCRRSWALSDLRERAEFTATVPGDDLTDGRVHRIAVVFNASAKTINLYYDGSKIYTKSGVTGQLTASSSLTTGGIGSDFTQHWNGSISNARVTLGALKPSQYVSNLLKSSPDQHSLLAGVDLVNQKVSYLSIMGGSLSEFDDASVQLR